jgi:hypothetical protein
MFLWNAQCTISIENDGVEREDRTVTEAIEKPELVQNVNQTSTASGKDLVPSNRLI